MGILVVTLGSVLTIVTILRLSDTTLRNILVAAFACRLGLALFHAFVAPLPDSTVDAAFFERSGWEIARGWQENGATPKLSITYAYQLWIGFIYCIFGREPLIPQFANVIFGTISVYVVYLLTLNISGHRRAAYISALIIVFFPTLALYSAITMRESLIVMASATSVYFFVRWIKFGALMSMFLAVSFIMIAGSLHEGMLPIALIYIFFLCFYRPVQNNGPTLDNAF